MNVMLILGLMVGMGEPQDLAAKEVGTALVRLNDAFAKKDAGTIAMLMTDDHIAILSVGVRQTKQEALRTLSDFNFSAYVTEDLQVTMLNKDVALVTFRAKIQGTYRGMAYPPDNFASAIWVRQRGRWLERFYQETGVAKKRPS